MKRVINIKNIYPVALGIAVLLLSCSTYSVDGNDGNGNSPLHGAVIEGNGDLVKELIDQGGDLNPGNEQGVTPLRLAAYMNNRDMVRLLIENGVEINYRDKDLRSRASNLFGNNILRYQEKERNFFLTFDAGDDNTNIDYILKTLKKYKIIATFFVTGTFINRFPADVRRIVSDGHVVGNHTFTHAYSYRNQDHLLNELYETEITFSRVTGREMTRIWRAPYLQHMGKPWMLKAAGRLGYRHIDVSLYSKDWLTADEKQYLSNEKFVDFFRNRIDFHNVNRVDADGVNYKRFRKRFTDYHGIIMLMHTGRYRKNGDDFVYTLEEVIIQLISCGYRFDNCRKFEEYK